MEKQLKKCCNLCPYNREKTLFLEPDRAEEFAYLASNPYNDFVCHKTGVVVEEGYNEGDIIRGEESLTCFGFKYLQNELNSKKQQKVDYSCFSDEWEMIEHHTEEYFKNNQDENR